MMNRGVDGGGGGGGWGGGGGGKPDAFKNDFPNALKRNLHNWAQWRVDVNDQLVTNLMTGHRQVEVQPLGRYLHNSRHPTENPCTLLAYSASSDNISSLGMRRFLHYGIPRAKLALGPTGAAGRVHGDQGSQWEGPGPAHSGPPSRTPSTYTIPEAAEDAPYLLEHDPTTRQHDPFYEPPYHPPEPEPDYERNRNQHNNAAVGAGEGWEEKGEGGWSNVLGSSDSEEDASSSTSGSSDTETLYGHAHQRVTSRCASTNRTKPSSSRRPISRTYSTLNALDPIYMSQTGGTQKGSKNNTTKQQQSKNKKQSEIHTETAQVERSHPFPPSPPSPSRSPPPPLVTRTPSFHPVPPPLFTSDPHYPPLPLFVSEAQAVLLGYPAAYPPPGLLRHCGPAPPTSYLLQRHSSYEPTREVVYPKRYLSYRHSVHPAGIYY